MCTLRSIRCLQQTELKHQLDHISLSHEAPLASDIIKYVCPLPGYLPIPDTCTCTAQCTWRALNDLATCSQTWTDPVAGHSWSCAHPLYCMHIKRVCLHKHCVHSTTSGMMFLQNSYFHNNINQNWGEGGGVFIQWTCLYCGTTFGTAKGVLNKKKEEVVSLFQVQFCILQCVCVWLGTCKQVVSSLQRGVLPYIFRGLHTYMQQGRWWCGFEVAQAFHALN